MKKLIVFLSLIVGLNVSAASSVFSTNIMTTNYTSYLLSGPVIVDSVTLVTTNTGTVVRFYDNNTAGVPVYTNGGYTNLTYFASNVVSQIVDTYGVTNNYTNAVLFGMRTAVAAATNTLPERAAFVLNTSFISSATDLGYFSKGLVLSNDVRGIQAIVYYRRP